MKNEESKWKKLQITNDKQKLKDQKQGEKKTKKSKL